MAFSITQPGGYVYEFVDTNLPDEFECPICTLVPRDVHQASCCGKMFCKSCLDSLKRRSNSIICPNCHKDLTNNFFKDVNINKKIRNLYIYCTNQKKSCRWEGPLRHINEHLSKCLLQTVECRNSCGQRLDRNNLKEHLLSTCPRRIVSCVYCQKEDEYQIICGDRHYKKCTGILELCPNNGCEEKIPQHLITQHRNTCPKEVVVCQYFYVGCNKKMKRENVAQHNKDKMKDHCLHITSILFIVLILIASPFLISRIREQYNEYLI